MAETKAKSVITLTDRAFLAISAVDEVISFDESIVNLSVMGSVLAVSGEELSIVKLSLESGEISISGRIDAIVYTDEQPKKRLLSRIFG